MTPVVRLLPPAWWAAAGGDDASWTVFLAIPEDLGSLATSAIGLGVDHPAPGVSRVRGSQGDLERLAEELARRGWQGATDLHRAVFPHTRWVLKTQTLDTSRPLVMGILNLTSDSFSGDGVGTDATAAARRAEALRAAGATIIDVGAETARADRPVLDASFEADVVATAVGLLVREGHLVSVDTYKGPVAGAALAAGAEIVNDISGLQAGTGAARAASAAGAGYVLNFSYAVPKRRPDSPPVYTDAVAETIAWMFDRVRALQSEGLALERLVIDPGIAFGKSHDEDLQVLRRLGEFRSLGVPILLAHSRKNYIGSVTGRPPGERDLETHASTVLGYVQGARLFRVHDVAGTVRALTMAEAIVAGSPGDWAPGNASWPWAAAATAAHMTREAPTAPPPPGQRW